MSRIPRYPKLLFLLLCCYFCSIKDLYVSSSLMFNKTNMALLWRLQFTAAQNMNNHARSCHFSLYSFTIFKLCFTSRVKFALPNCRLLSHSVFSKIILQILFWFQQIKLVDTSSVYQHTSFSYEKSENKPTTKQPHQ